MSAMEQPALPFHENTDLSDARFPWVTFDQAADKVYPNTDSSLDVMKSMTIEPIHAHDIGMDAATVEQAFAQRVIAFVKRCDEISYSFVEDSEKYHTVRHSMALRVVGLYFDTGHYLDARSELGYLKKELEITPEDPLRDYVASAYDSMGMSPSKNLEPMFDISYMQNTLDI
jgi:hypothetical protein